jgi:hypothetical protein
VGGVWKRLISEIVSVGEKSNTIPENFQLKQNYPNPFNPVTKIEYQIPFESKVKIIIYDVEGKVVKILLNEQKSPGTYEIVWDASEFSSGVYFFKLSAGSFVETRKMILTK